MSREIKFRGWEPSVQTIIPWEELRHQLNFALAGSGDYLKIMQFTGLRDKNGAEIYEGDIVRDKWKTTSVRYHDEGFCPFTYSGGGEMYWAECEVIGNIYENPELLEKQHETDI